MSTEYTEHTENGRVSTEHTEHTEKVRLPQLRIPRKAFLGAPSSRRAIELLTADHTEHTENGRVSTEHTEKVRVTKMMATTTVIALAECGR